MSKTAAEDLLIGAHTSASGGVHHALLEGQEIGATTIQFFTSNQRRWEGKPIEEEEVIKWEAALKETGLKKVMSHDSYLINLGSPDPELVNKSRKAFKLELERCHQLGVAFLNFHPGAATAGTEEECLDQIVASIEGIQDLIHAGPTRLLIETTAGQGTTVGWRFDQIGYLIKKLHHQVKIGVCIDTCHIFAAGYDIRTAKGWEETLNSFDKEIGVLM